MTRRNIIEAIFFGSLLVWGSFLFPVWVLMLSIWTAIYIYAKWKHLDELLTSPAKHIWQITVYSIPLLFTASKFFVAENIIPYSWFWINRLEHFLFSLGLTILLWPFFTRTITKLNRLESALLVVGFIVIIGNLNEFFEYGVRIYFGLDENWRFAAYYWDTIYDLAINLAGAIVGFVAMDRLSMMSKSGTE